jgi:hypothetical protein
MKRLFFFCVAFSLPWTGWGEDVALVIGIGDVRYEKSPATEASDFVPVWGRIVRPDARHHAEAAFRELVPAALREPYLYARAPRWHAETFNGFKPAVLLTDGFTDNAYLPVASRIISEVKRLAQDVAQNDDFVFFASGIGEAAGWDSTLYDRFHKPIKLSSLVNLVPPRGGRGRRLLLVRIYPEAVDVRPTTLMLADEASFEQLGRWFQTAQRQVDKGKPASTPNRIFPGMPIQRTSLTPIRMKRLGERLVQKGDLREGLTLLDFGQVMEPVKQQVQLVVKVGERKIFKKIRRAGPLFTIIEEDSDELDRIDRTIDRLDILEQLSRAVISSSASRGVIEELEESLADSFERTMTFGGVGYQLKFDKPAGMLQITYED